MPKHVKEMSPEEYRRKLAEVRRGNPTPVKVPTKKATEMTDEEFEAAKGSMGLSHRRNYFGAR